MTLELVYASEILDTLTGLKFNDCYKNVSITANVTLNIFFNKPE